MNFKREQTHEAGDLRCGNCQRLLARGHLEAGEIELCCPRCKNRIVLRATRPNLAPPDGLYGDRHASSQSSSKLQFLQDGSDAL